MNALKEQNTLVKLLLDIFKKRIQLDYSNMAHGCQFLFYPQTNRQKEEGEKNEWNKLGVSSAFLWNTFPFIGMVRLMRLAHKK